MKKRLLLILAFITLIVLSTYIFIPAHIQLNNSILVKANSKGLYRRLQDKESLTRIFNTSMGMQLNEFVYNGFSFHIQPGIFEDIPINIKDQGITLSSLLKCFKAGNDSTGLTWRVDIETGSDPFTRLLKYFTAQQLKATIANILMNTKKFAEEEASVYGIVVKQIQVVDTLLITTKQYFKTYPSDTVVNEMVNSLKKYIAAENIKQTGPPMLNIRLASDNSYETMVAIPVNKATENKDEFIFKRMFPGRILEAEIRGGASTVKKAFTAMDLYMQDHQYSAPAIPFESMITDRINEPDTSKWITKIYYPIY